MASAAWLLGEGRSVAQGAPPSARFRDAAGRGVGDWSSEVAGAHGSPRPTEAVLGRGLVVDDKALVRRALTLFLTRAGFAAAAAESGAEALELLRVGEEATTCSSPTSSCLA